MQPHPVVLVTWAVGALLTFLVMALGIWTNKPYRSNPVVASVAVRAWPFFWLVILFGALQSLASSRKRRKKATRLWSPLRVGLLVVVLTVFCCGLVGALTLSWGLYPHVCLPP